MKPQEFKILPVRALMNERELTNQSYGGWELVCIVPVTKEERSYLALGLPPHIIQVTTFHYHFRRPL